jgi:hypothetical protein
MPFKHNAARRHRIPKARHRVTNWPAYEAGLKRRGNVTFCLRWQIELAFKRLKSLLHIDRLSDRARIAKLAPCPPLTRSVM